MKATDLLKTGSRKFTLAAAFWFSGSIGLMVGRLDGAGFVALAAVVLAAFGAANAAEHIAQARNGTAPKATE